MKIAFLDTQLMGPGTDLSLFETLGTVEFYESTSPTQVEERIYDVDVVITNKVKLDADTLKCAKGLQLIALTCTGTDGVDLDFCRNHEIAVANVAGYSTASVVEQTFTLLFGLMRQTAWHDQYVKTEYKSANMITTFDRAYPELNGKTWGIIGLGGIGRGVATAAQAFGAKVVYHSTSGRNTEAEFPHLSLEELCQQCDVISIHAPLNNQTKNLINKEVLKLMKPTAYLLNLGRGGIVNEIDLAAALEAGHLAGAGLDVFACEPINPDNPLLSLKHSERFLGSPHIAWASQEARQRLAIEVVQNIQAYKRGEARNRVV